LGDQKEHKSTNLNKYKRQLKVAQSDNGSGEKSQRKKIKSLSVVDALEKAEKDAETLLRAETKANEAWVIAPKGNEKKKKAWISSEDG
jgi:hypothetical protein